MRWKISRTGANERLPSSQIQHTLDTIENATPEDVNRLWELQQDGIPATLITDNMAGHFLHSGRIGCVVVGADRIAANGDVANKIGTYSLAVLAKENQVPFYVAAPVSTLDLSLATGELIPIEQRSASEVRDYLRENPQAIKTPLKG